MTPHTHDLWILRADMAVLGRLTGIAENVTELIAGTGLTANVADMRGRHYVSVPLAEGGAVVLWANTRYPGAWVTAWPTPSRSDVTQVPWPLETDTELMAEITAAVVADVLYGCGLLTPFGWGRIQTSPITDLADELVARGVDHEAIKLTPLRTLDDDGRPRSVHGNRNELRLSDQNDPERTLVIRFDSNVGWSADQVMPYPGGSGRLDLASALKLGTDLPRVGADDVTPDELASLLVADTGWCNPFDDDHDDRQLRRYCVTPEETAVSSKESAELAATAWLRWAGFVPADRRGDGQALTSAVELHVDYTEKQISIGGVQRYKGVASVSGRTPVVVARSGFSEPARRWASTAEMLLFTIAEDGLLRPANGLAAGYTPVEIGMRPRTCDDAACLFGCALDDEFCINHQGRYADPDAESLRL